MGRSSIVRIPGSCTRGRTGASSDSTLAIYAAREQPGFPMGNAACSAASHHQCMRHNWKHSDVQHIQAASISGAALMRHLVHCLGSPSNVLDGSVINGFRGACTAIATPSWHWCLSTPCCSSSGLHCGDLYVSLQVMENCLSSLETAAQVASLQQALPPQQASLLLLAATSLLGARAKTHADSLPKLSATVVSVLQLAVVQVI